MIATRLLIGGAGSFTPPYVIQDVTTATAGGWTQIPDAHARYYNGVTYFGYVDGSNGNIEIRTYTHSTGVTSSAFVLHAALSTPGDTHNAPAILVRDSDKRIVVAYSGHNGSQLYLRISTNPEDISAFASEQTLDASVGGTAYTYPFLMQRLAETNDPLYIWFRDVVAGTTFLCYTKSTDGGATWSALHQIYATTGKATYWKITTDGQWRIDFVVTDDNPNNSPCRIFHFYADDTDYHQSDGTAIGTFGPLFDTSHLTLVYDSSSGPGWPTDAIYDGTNPRFVYSVDNGSLTDSTFAYARWTGSAWTLSSIVAAGAGIVDPSPVAALDAVDLTRCYLTKIVSGDFHLWRYTTADNGATWTGLDLTPGSTVDNIYPTSVKDHPSPGLAAVWLYGTYTSDQNNALGIKGVTS